MIQKKVPDVQLFRKAAGIQGRGVMFFIGFKLIRLTVEAKSLMEQPAAVFSITPPAFSAWLIAAAGQILSPVQRLSF